VSAGFQIYPLFSSFGELLSLSLAKYIILAIGSCYVFHQVSSMSGYINPITSPSAVLITAPGFHRSFRLLLF